MFVVGRLAVTGRFVCFCSGSPSGSAVCAYGLSGKYMNDVSSVYNGQYYYWENGFKTDTPSKFMVCDICLSVCLPACLSVCLSGFT